MDLDSIEEDWKVWGVWCVDDLHAEEHGGFQHGHYVDNFASEEEAIQAWNTRTERTCHDTDTDDWHFTCSSCNERIEMYWTPNYCPNCGARVVE